VVRRNVHKTPNRSDAVDAIDSGLATASCPILQPITMLSSDQLEMLPDDTVPPWETEGALPSNYDTCSSIGDRDRYKGAAAFVAELLESSVVQKVVHPNARAVLERTLSTLAQSDAGALATALALAKAGEVLKDAAEGRPKVLDVALDTIRVALALYGEGLGRSHHRTLATRLQVAETLVAMGRGEEGRGEFIVVVDELEGDEVEIAALRTRALRGLEGLDVRHTVSATLRRERRRRLRAETAALEASCPILYGPSAGRRNPVIDEGGAIEAKAQDHSLSMTIDEGEEEDVSDLEEPG